MATEAELFEALRAANEAGAEDDAQRIAQMIQEGRDQRLSYEDPDPEGHLSEDMLRNDPDWLEASQIYHNMETGHDFEGSDEELAQYGIDVMGWFNNNMVQMGGKAASLLSADQEQKDAFLYLMEGYDDLNPWTLENAGRISRGVITDPTTYVGLGTLGGAFLGRQAAKLGTREGIKKALQFGTVAGFEGAVYGGLQDTIRQQAQVNADGRDQLDASQIALSAGVGGVFGGALGVGGYKAFDVLAPRVRRWMGRGSSQEATQADPSVLGGDTPEQVIARTSEAPVDNTTPSNPISATGTLLKRIRQEVVRLTDAAPLAVEDGFQNLTQLRRQTSHLSTLMEAAGRQGEDLHGFLTRMNVTSAQLQTIKQSSQDATDRLKRELANLARSKTEIDDAGRLAQIQTKMDEVENSLAVVERADLELSTQSGRDLRGRQEGLNVGELRGITIKSLMDTKALDRPEAEAEYLRLIDLREKYLADTKEVRELQENVQRAIQDDNPAEAMRLRQHMKTIQGRVDQQRNSNGEPIGPIRRTINRASEVAAEVMISNVFSPTTVQVNVIPSGLKAIYRPASDWMVQGALANPSATREMVSTYGAMTSMAPTAFRAAVAAFRYERSLLLGDPARFLESGPIIPKKYGGGVMRIFPRLLQTTDEFFSQMAYRGYVVGRTSHQAMEDGLARGLEGKQLDDFVESAVKDATDRAYGGPVDQDSDVINLLLDQAMDRGLSGPRADRWVRNELNKNGDLLRQAENQAGRDYAADLLFKREFSQEGIEGVARGYERFVKKNPWMRVMGQLFFRTPVRVFQEGIRLTPGLNLISTNMLRDLSGANGAARQVRATGEAMLSYSIAGSFLTLWAQGRITGAGPTDYRQRRQGENSGEFEPYTITLPNGDKWNFRNLDPISTPYKIMANAMERLEMLQYRQRQGENIGDSEFQQAFAYIKVATGAIAQAIHDANLTQGISEILDAYDIFANENDTSGSMVSFIGDKLSTIVPNTWYKAQMMENPVLGDPQSLEQYLQQRINPQDPNIVKQYTPLGRPRTLSNPMGGFSMLDPSSQEERNRGIPERELAVERELWTQTQVANVDFTPPYKTSFEGALGDIDLRRHMTADGEESLYDRWQRYAHESDMIDVLHETIVGSDLPYGTPSQPGARVSATREIINSYRRAALVRLFQEESGLQEAFIEEKLNDAEAQMGNRDDLRVPF